MSETVYPTGPLGSLIASQTGGGTPSRQNPAFWTGPIPWASVKDFAEGGTELLATEERISLQGLQASATNLIPANTPIVCTRMAVGRVAIAPMDVAINQDLKALTPARGVSTRYLLRLADYAKPKAEAVSVGSTVKGIKVSDYLNIRLPIAPLSAQPKIAEVVDTLDAAIRGTEAVVAKLWAMKQGLLHDLLTRGIDANGDLRPPHPEAPHLYHQTPLGWLPKEWGFSALGSVTTLITSGSRGWARYYADDGQLFVRSQNVRMGRLDLTDRQHVQVVASAEGARTGLEASDFLVTITGNGVGNACVVPSDWEEVAFVSQHVGLIRFFDKSLGCFAGRYFVEGAPGNRQILDAQYGQSKPGLSLSNLRDLVMGIPPEAERSRLLDTLSEIDGKISGETFLLAKLRLQKAGLMDDLLTGRVPVTPLL